MSEYEATRTMPAVAELVFDEASDLGAMYRWLPGELDVQPGEPPEATVTVEHLDPSGRPMRERALAEVRNEQMRVEWGTRDTGRYAGWLQVEGRGAGVSEVTVHLSFFSPGHPPLPPQQVQAELEESLDRLAEQVRLRAESTG